MGLLSGIGKIAGRITGTRVSKPRGFFSVMKEISRTKQYGTKRSGSAQSSQTQRDSGGGDGD